ncbi:MAG: type I-E CRISPR-associated endoribonuclease Cas2 [Lachnospiraceae bacterium]|jgi:CRISPR-associated protein Cas2|nr:type I-E CRISPR-associated endoribonuclease Cas2 [Lachnospiraceae bacterium]
MVVITMNSCPPKLRGDLTKWLFEIHTGVYVGQVNAKVREMLWSRVCQNIKDGQAVMVYSFANEQHLEFRTHNTFWKVRDLDGIKLMMRPKSPEQTEEVLPKGFSSASKRLMAGRRRKNPGNIGREWAFLDIETDGLDFEKSKIIEIAAIVADEEEIKLSWNALIKQDTALPPQIVELTHITDEMLDRGIELDDALRQLSDIVKGRTVVCFNKSFDITFLDRGFRDNNLEDPFGRVIDALALARKRVRDIDNYRLGSLAEYFGVSCEQHRALPDCETLYRVFLKLNEI